MLLGGYAAEELMLHSLSPASENDLQAGDRFGLQDGRSLRHERSGGPVYHEHHTEHPFFGQTLATDGGISDATVRAIETEARRILEYRRRAGKEPHQRAPRRRSIKLVDVLLEQETIERPGLMAIFGEGEAAAGTRGGFARGRWAAPSLGPS